MGFLANRKAFSAQDVQDVAQELLEETLGSGGMAVNSIGRDARSGASSSGGELGIDIGSLDLGGLDLGRSSKLLAVLAGGQIVERIVRVERSLLRMEQLNSATLVLLQQLVSGLQAQIGQVKEGE
jgi:hypothetical protein